MKNKTGKDKTTMTAREVAVLVEDLKSQFRTFGDGLKTINRILDGIETTVARTWEKITEMDLRLIRVEKDISEIKNMLKTHSERLSRLEELTPK